MSYKDELKKAMTLLAQHEKTLFVGQSVRYGGQAMFPTLRDLPMEKRIEFPVAEDMQMGYCTGLALAGFIPVSIYPRFDFLLLAVNQLVNHLDKLPTICGLRPKVLIRTAVGFNAGPQHQQNHTEAFRQMLKTVLVFDLQNEEDIVSSYSLAMRHQGSVLLIEHRSQYDRI